MVSHAAKAWKTTPAQEVAIKIYAILSANDNSSGLDETTMGFDLYKHPNYSPTPLHEEHVVLPVLAKLPQNVSSKDVARFTALVQGVAEGYVTVGSSSLLPFLTGVADALQKTNGSVPEVAEEVKFYHAKGQELQGLILEGVRYGLFTDHNQLKPIQPAISKGAAK